MEKIGSISAVVISYNGLRFIADCLSTLTAELSRYDHEVIIVDNNSADGTREFIESNYPRATLIRNTANLGFARAINQGIKASSGEFLWLLNQDIRITPGCLSHLLSCAQTLSRPGVIGPRLIGFDGKLQKFCRRFPNYRHLIFELSGLAYIFPHSAFFNDWKMGKFDHLSSRPVAQPMGAAMLIPRTSVDAVGLMDETFGIFFNDVDLCYRLEAAGYVNYYCAEAVIEHFAGGSVSRQKSKMVWLSHWGMMKYFFKRESERNSAALRIVRLPLQVIAGVLLILAAIPRSAYYLVRKII